MEWAAKEVAGGASGVKVGENLGGVLVAEDMGLQWSALGPCAVPPSCLPAVCWHPFLSSSAWLLPRPQRLRWGQGGGGTTRWQLDSATPANSAGPLPVCHVAIFGISAT
jgi:hypothetical protein